MTDIQYMRPSNYLDPKTGKPIKSVSGWLMSEKYDGQRAIWNGTNLISRNDNIINAPEWFINLLRKSPVMLDGELYLGRGTFNMTGAFRSRHPDNNVWLNVKYILFDIPDINSTLKLLDRRAKLEKIVADINSIDNIFLMDEITVKIKYSSAWTVGMAIY